MVVENFISQGTQVDTELTPSCRKSLEDKFEK